MMAAVQGIAAHSERRYAGRLCLDFDTSRGRPSYGAGLPLT